MTFSLNRRAFAAGLSAALLLSTDALAKGRRKTATPRVMRATPAPVAEAGGFFSLFAAPQEEAKPAAPAIRKLVGFAKNGNLTELVVQRWGETHSVPLGSVETAAQFNRACADLSAGGAVGEMDPALLDLLCKLTHDLSGGKTVFLTSGYRTMGHQGNLKARKQTEASAEGSMHPKGKAGDIRIPGVSNALIARHANGIGAGMVIAYGGKHAFTHVDTRNG